MPQLLTNSPKRKWFILFIASLGVFMTSVDASIVNIALPAITKFYNAPLSTVEWVVMIYLITISSLLLTYGRLGDMYGHKPVYIIGFSIFIIASLLSSLSSTIGFLIISRALQALGGGMLMAVVQAIIAGTFNASERGRAIGINAVMVSLGLASGPTIGGFLVSSFGWQSIFTVNIPIGLIGITAAWLIVPNKKGTPQKFDFTGAFMSFIFLSAFLLAVSHGQAWGWQSVPIVSLFMIATIAFAIFIYTEKTYHYPMIQLILFRNRLFTTANFAAMLNYMTQYVVSFLMPFYLLNLMHMETNRAGLIMSAFPIVAALIAPFSGTISDRIGSRLLTTLGMGLIMISFISLSSPAIVSRISLVIISLGLAGLGNGLFLAPNNSAIMGSVPKSQAGIGSGMIATMRSIGQVMGVAVSGAVFSNRLATYSSGLTLKNLNSINQQSFMLALRDTYWVAAAIAVLAVIISWGRGSSGKKLRKEKETAA